MTQIFLSKQSPIHGQVLILTQLKVDTSAASGRDTSQEMVFSFLRDEKKGPLALDNESQQNSVV